ncbi:MULTISPECIES: MarR family winged helix-turn-helix transcriptional regulator [unclassified Leifsonia]|uniref:MarR family winged helix-turn-helix transcriptional regulator n=1 Tax=unclassified Leifsonia TaxID=2663824 RepID=UPI0006FAA254|nr:MULTISPECIES: MarR family transcriptional regulator [unclassified Leifsonia]KQX05530.1 transcriptional regulator [Leifsonia sp. Root1293]KRA09164.1 transcriptional regulator [Leifsonia sp. Root60]
MATGSDETRGASVAPSARGERPPFSPVISLLTASAVWDAELAKLLRDLGLTTRKYALLAHIHAIPGISFSELARHSRITVQTVHTAVHALSNDGLVTDATAHAGSASALQATELGEQALAEAERRLATLDSAFTAAAPTLSEALRGMHEEPFEANLQEH